MKTTFTSKLISGLAILLLTQASSQAAIIVDSYSYGVNPHASYPDSGGELTDGVTQTPVWPSPIVLADIVPLVGWQNTDPTVTFNFTSQEVTSLSLWLADSDGNAAVALPTSVRLFDTATSGATFDQSFAINNPAGSGSMVRFDFDGFAVTTDSLTMELTPFDQWVMMSEVSFNAVPEPSGALLATSGLALLAFRRKRR